MGDEHGKFRTDVKVTRRAACYGAEWRRGWREEHQRWCAGLRAGA